MHNVSISTSCCQEVPKQIRAAVMGLAENSSGNTGEKKKRIDSDSEKLCEM